MRTEPKSRLKTAPKSLFFDQKVVFLGQKVAKNHRFLLPDMSIFKLQTIDIV
jgi:hypothetical protein